MNDQELHELVELKRQIGLEIDKLWYNKFRRDNQIDARVTPDDEPIKQQIVIYLHEMLTKVQ